jgi:hypothetical protein
MKEHFDSWTIVNGEATRVEVTTVTTQRAELHSEGLSLKELIGIIVGSILGAGFFFERHKTEKNKRLAEDVLHSSGPGCSQEE